MRGRFAFVRVADAGEGAQGLWYSALDGVATRAGRLGLSLGPKIIGGRYFRLDVDGRSFASGLANAGRYPGLNWADIFDLDVPPEAAVDYLRPLAFALPAGGHLMVDYEGDRWRDTQLGLLSGIPPIATPMGELLYEAGSGSSFKDWYFPEGGQEGGRKLQGNKALSEAHAAETGGQRAAELREFLARPAAGDPARLARGRAAAERLLEKLPA